MMKGFRSKSENQGQKKCTVLRRGNGEKKNDLQLDKW